MRMRRWVTVATFIASTENLEKLQRQAQDAALVVAAFTKARLRVRAISSKYSDSTTHFQVLGR